MRNGSSPHQTWWFEVSDAPALTFAVRCRDQLRLPVPTTIDVPPAVPASESTSISIVSEPEAPAQWLAWWRRLLDRTGGWMRQPASVDDAGPSTQVMTISDAVDLIDPGPLLRYAARVADLPIDAAPAGQAPAVPPDVVLSAVEQSARRNAVPVAALQGGIHLLPGATDWHAVVRPGYGLMMISSSMPSNDTLHRFICDVLDSSLHGERR